MLPLQKLDISQAEFEDFCEKYAFQWFERAKNGSGFNGDYEQMWDDFHAIQPSDKFKYEYITSLGTLVKFEYNLDNYINPGDDFYTIVKIEQVIHDSVNHL